VKTVDAFGRTEKNRRGQVVITQKGWTAADVARRMRARGAILRRRLEHDVLAQKLARTAPLRSSP
jgi:hypothetical protein